MVGLGPRKLNFRVRRWRDRFREFVDPVPHDLWQPHQSRHLPGWRVLEPSRAVWKSRDSILALADSQSGSPRAASVVGGYDLWPLVEAELRGVADLQFPWSARAMDEAGAALDALAPQGGHHLRRGRRMGTRAGARGSPPRHLPTVALQHGFIYRHWLNYLHQPDEPQPSAANPADAGFPRPGLHAVV